MKLFKKLKNGGINMKTIIKNILLSFVIIFMILSIISFAFNYAVKYFYLLDTFPFVTNGEITEQVIEAENNLYNYYKTIFGENAPVATLAYFQGSWSGMSQVLDTQFTTFIASGLLGICIGLILSLSENSKIKDILIFIFITVLVLFLCILYIYAQYTFAEGGLIGAVIECFVMPYWIYYLVIYILLYIIKFFIGKNKAKKLNQSLNMDFNK